MPQPAPLASRRRSKEMAGLDKILFRRTDNNRAAQKGISSDSCCLCYRMNLDRGPLPPPIHGHARIRYRSLQVRVWRGVSATDISLTRSWIFSSFFFFFSDLFKDRYARKLKTIFARKLFREFLRSRLRFEDGRVAVSAESAKNTLVSRWHEARSSTSPEVEGRLGRKEKRGAPVERGFRRGGRQKEGGQDLCGPESALAPAAAVPPWPADAAITRIVCARGPA